MHIWHWMILACTLFWPKLIYINNIGVQMSSLIDVHLQPKETSKHSCSVVGGHVVMCNYYSNPQARVLSLW